MCILYFKTTWSELQMPSQTAPAEAKLRCVYLILQPHVQSSSCFRCQVRLLPPRRSGGAYTQFKNLMVRVSVAKSDCSRRGEAEVRIFNLKTTWSEFQMPSQTAPAKAKQRCVYLILKPHGQSSISSPESVQSSCVG